MSEYRPLLAALRGLVSGERALEDVRAIARHHRIQSSPGYDAAAAWLADALARAGLTPAVENAAGDGRTRRHGALMPQGWSCERASATLVSGAAREKLCEFPAAKLSLIQRSTPARGRFPLMALDDGTEPVHYERNDVRGAVVLTSGSVHRVHALAVVERGAAGLLSFGRRLLPPVRTDAHDRDSLAYTSFWWGEDPARGWGFVVSPDAGEALRARLSAGEPLELEVEIESGFADRPVPLVTAALGPAGPDVEEVLVLGHLCHPEPGANDNASGAAATLETARALAALGGAGSWRRRVRFLWMPEWNGTLAWLAGDPARARRTVAAINLDMVGEAQDDCGSTLLLEHPPHFLASFAEELLAAIRHDAQEWVSGFSGPGHYSLARMAEIPFSGGSDHVPLIDPSSGVPCPMLIQWPDRYYHSSLDTPERCDPASLALAVRCAATYAGFLAAAGPSDLESLADLVRRGASRRLLAAADQPEPARAGAREAARGQAAIASLARLGVPPGSIAARARAFADGTPRETAAARGGAASGRVPARRLDGPLDLLPHLLPGYGALPAAGRERLRALERELPGGRLTMDLAWLACDGTRPLAELARLIERESGERVAADAAGPSLAALFESFSELGLSAWKEGSA